MPESIDWPRPMQRRLAVAAAASFSFLPFLPSFSSAVGPRCRITWMCSGSGRWLSGRVLENAQSSVGNLRGFRGGHISRPVRIVSGSEAGASP